MADLIWRIRRAYVASYKRMYVHRNAVARSRNAYTSSVTLTPWYHFTRRERFYGDLKSLGNNKTYFFAQCPIFWPDIYFIDRFSLKYPIWNVMEIRKVEAKLYKRTSGRTWWREKGYANTPNNECRPVTETQHVSGTRQYTYNSSSTFQLKIHSTSQPIWHHNTIR